MRAAGALLLAIPLLPLQSMAGEFREDSAFVGPAEWALGIAIFGTIAWLLAWTLPQGALRRSREVSARLFGEGAGRSALVVLLATLAAILMAVSTLAFEHRPQLVDSVIQLFQAKIFAAGAVSAPAPAAPEFFVTQHMIVEGGSWYSQYPPGHSALLATGVLLGVPWLVPILLTLASAALLYGFAKRAYGETTARLTLLLLVLAPFFWFMGASFMSHVSSLAGVCAFLYCFARWEEDGRLGMLAAAGMGLGVGFLSRPLEVLAIGAVFGGVLCADAVRKRRWQPLVVFGAAFLLVGSLYLAFNAVTTGNPLRPGYIELWGTSHGLGFHESPWGERHTPLAGLRNQILDLSLLGVFLFEWPIPALWPLGIALAAGWLGRRWDLRLLAAFLIVPAANFFYWHRDTFLGPRFLYVTLAFVVPLTARALVEGCRRLKGRTWKPGGFPAVDLTTWASLVIALSALYTIGYGAPARFLIYRTSMGSMKLDLVEMAHSAGIDRGIVFVSESWGSRVIAQLRGLGAPASTVERAYRQSDLCDLDGIVRRARADEWSPDQVETALNSAMVGQESLVLVEVSGDPTARFKPGSQLTTECLAEIRYDQQGYSLFTPHLPANDPGLSGPLIFARDLGAHNTKLARRYPGRPVWVYRGGEFHASH
ncbi:MAG TPA: glycosyltransferase family 39 protein [Gemmatimonadota bacterium]|nr:glycosyltransferase family 39 protein [Gemmatimonadota bacterium]